MSAEADEDGVEADVVDEDAAEFESEDEEEDEEDDEVQLKRD